jgi:two-component system response regulator WspF
VRVAVVNDLRLAVEVQRRMLAAEPGCELAWVATNGAEAVEKCRTDLPDLVLMDLVMPVMDGVEATRRIMRATPCPILVVTSTVEGHVDRVYDALGAGALDAVATPTIGSDGAVKGAEPVLRKLRTIRRLHGPASSAARPSAPDAPVAAPVRGERMILLGASTGGPEAVAAVLRGLSPDLAAPIVLVQHLGRDYVPGLVEWLAPAARRPVRAIAAGERPSPRTVHVAHTDDHLVLRADGVFDYDREPVDQPYRPSVDVFFASVARRGVPPGAAAVLTGMGRDGAAGLLALRDARWATFAQDQATSVVWGMPRACAENGAARTVLPITALGAALEAAWRAAAVPAARGTGA